MNSIIENNGKKSGRDNGSSNRINNENRGGFEETKVYRDLNTRINAERNRLEKQRVMSNQRVGQSSSQNRSTQAGNGQISSQQRPQQRNQQNRNNPSGQRNPNAQRKPKRKTPMQKFTSFIGKTLAVISTTILAIFLALVLMIFLMMHIQL